MRKVIFIDWFETLCSHRLWGHLITENPIFFEHIQTILFKENKLLCNEWKRGYTRFCNICHFFENNGITREAIQTEFIRDLSFHTMNSPLFLPLIQKLRQKGYRIYIATDYFDVFGCYIYPYHHLETYFDGYISSAEVGCLKKDCSENGVYPFFKTFLHENHFTPADCVLIDNSSDNCRIYQEQGMQTFHVSNPDDVEKALTRLIQENN